jgi:hypothetical protein
VDLLLIIGGVIAAIVVVWLVARYYERRRTQELARLALARGFLYQAQGQPFSPEEGERIFSISRLGGARVRNILRGTAGGLECVVFDSFRRSGRGGHSETVAAFHLSLPDFELTAMRHGLNTALMSQVFSRLGFSVLTFDSHPEFSHSYLLLGRDEAALRRLFTPGLLSYFEGLDRSQRWAVESGGGWLLVHRGWQRIRPQQLPFFLDEAATVAAAIQREAGQAVTA